MNELDSFLDVENQLAKEFRTQFSKEFEHMSKAITYFWEYLRSLKDIDLNDYPKATINLFMGSNFDLIFQSFCLLTRGYFRPSLVLLRPVYESIVLSMYFCEFPDKEEAYRKCTNKNKWFKNEGRTPQLIQKINKNGKIFTVFKEEGKENLLAHLIGNPLAEINKFIHLDIDYIFTSIRSNSNPQLILGPKKLAAELRSGLIIFILESTLFSLIVLEKAIKPLDPDFVEYTKDMTSFILELRRKNKSMMEMTVNASPNP